MRIHEIVNIVLNFLVIVLLFLFITSCHSNFKERDIYGIWKVDSAYTYYNGFTNTELYSVDWAEYEYSEGGKMKEMKERAFKPHLFEIQGDTLIHRFTNGKIFHKYKIFELNEERMVLKKNHPFTFQGPNQERYEIRFFSKK